MTIRDEFNTLTAKAVLPLPTVHTPEEVQAILRVSKTGISALLHSGELRAIRVGRKWLIPASAIHDFLNRQPL
jgi:excisionase family DNA binding protein